MCCIAQLHFFLMYFVLYKSSWQFLLFLAMLTVLVTCWQTLLVFEAKGPINLNNFTLCAHYYIHFTIQFKKNIAVCVRPMHFLTWHLALLLPVTSPSFLRSNPFYEPRTSSPVRPSAGSPSLDVGSGQKRRAPPLPSSSPGLGPSAPAPKPSSSPDRERTQPVGPSPVAAVMGRELASSSPKVNSLHLNVINLIYPLNRYTDACDNKTTNDVYQKLIK